MHYDNTPPHTKKHPQKMLTYAGRTLSLPAWSKLLGIPCSTLYARWHRSPALSHADILGVESDTHTWRGHRLVIFEHEDFLKRYYDTLTPAPPHGHPAGQERPCPYCGLTADPWPDEQEEMLPDPCLGYLPGVKGACCGHGCEQPFVYFHDDTDLEGNAALAYFHQQGCTACPRPEEV